MIESQRFDGSPADWDAFVEAQPGATAAHLYGWRRVIEQVYGHDCPYLVTRDAGQITGVLPLVDVRSLAFGRFLVSMPYLNAGGPLGTPQSIANLADGANALAARSRAPLVEFRCLQPLYHGRQHAAEKVTCVLELPGEEGALWSKLGGKLRSQIRRPQKAGIEVRFGAAEIEPFFRVFARNMRDLGSPPHPRQFFEMIQRELGERVWFGCAYLQGEPVAAGCAIEFRGELEMTWASSLREHSALAPNMLLYWAFMERALTQRLTRFNFGRSTPGSGPHKFKLQWGAVDEPLYWYRWPAAASAGAPSKDKGSMAMAAKLWRHVPVPLANLIGARLRGGIPA